MKKILTVMLLIFIMSALLTSCAEYKNASEYCKHIKDRFKFEWKKYGVTHGACVSSIESGNFGAVAAALCNNEKFLEDYGSNFGNHGSCVNWVKGELE